MLHDRRTVLIVLALSLAGLVLAGRFLRGSSSAASAAPLTAPLVASAPSVTAATGGPVLVHVVGAVRHEGVYRLPAGARVRDAVRAAGGPRHGAMLDGLNLAERLADGEQVVVPGRGVPPGVGAASAAPGTPGAVVHLNSATAAQLDALDGIGPTLAARIVTWRVQHGGFKTVDDLGDVPGIGPSKLATLHAQVAP
jgi:competence protein ComEA